MKRLLAFLPPIAALLAERPGVRHPVLQFDACNFLEAKEKAPKPGDFGTFSVSC